MGKGFELKVQQDPQNKWTLKLIRELGERLESAMEQVTRDAAAFMLEEVKARAPDLKGFNAWYDGLVLSRVNSQLGPMYVIGASGGGSGKLDEDEIATSVLVFKPRKGSEPTREMLFLMETSPYTPDLIPFQPPKGRMDVEVRSVSPAEVEKVREGLIREWPKMRRAAKRAGIDIPEQPASFAEEEVTRNLAFQVLRAEFGIGQPVQAHWRPALRALKKEFPGLAERLYRTIGDPRYSGWRRQTMPPSQLKGEEFRAVDDFQKRLT